jgi:hypothetical protein
MPNLVVAQKSLLLYLSQPGCIGDVIQPVVAVIVTHHLPGRERERDLWIASGRSMRNEISAEQLEEAERPHIENLKRSALRIAQCRLFK